MLFVEFGFPHIFLHIFLTFLHFSGEFTNFFCRTTDSFDEFTHFFVDFCRDRRLRVSSKIFKILASRLFSSPCLSQILSSTPARPPQNPHLPGKVLYLTLFFSFPCFFSFLSSKWISCLHICTHMNIYICLCLLVDNENVPCQSFFSQLLKSYNRKEKMGDSKALWSSPR